MTREELMKIVSESNSFSDILKKQGKSVSGAAIKLLKETLDAYEIDTSMLYQKTQKHGGRPLSSLEENEILCQDSTYTTRLVKRYLLMKGLKENICENKGCCNHGEWLGKPLIMQLHHINGNNTDNRLENLIMLCPNCHSQTDNYSGKNKKHPQNYCVDCGKSISDGATRCCRCSAIMNNKSKVKNKPTKDALEEMIKTMSFRAISRIYGVSDKAVSKWCRRYGLPCTRKEIKEKYGPLV